MIVMQRSSFRKLYFEFEFNDSCCGCGQKWSHFRILLYHNMHAEQSASLSYDSRKLKSRRIHLQVYDTASSNQVKGHNKRKYAIFI